MKTKKFLFVVLGALLALSLVAFVACGTDNGGSDNRGDTTVDVTGITLDRNYLALEAEGTAKLTATVAPSNATDKAVTWISSDSEIVTVADGTVTAVGEGSATVTAKAGDFTATCEVEVVAEITEVNTVSELETALGSVAEGSYIQLNAGTYSLNSQIRLSGVSDVTLAGEGEVIVTCDEAFTNETGSKSYASLVTVYDSSDITIRNITFSDAKDITLSSGTDYGHGLNIIDSTAVELIDVTSQNNTCGIVIGHSSVTMQNVSTSGNTWGGVNIDAQSHEDDQTSLTVDAACSFGEDAQIYADGSTDHITVNAEGYTSEVKEDQTFWTKG